MAGIQYLHDIYMFFLEIFYGWGEQAIIVIGFAIGILGYIKSRDNPDDPDDSENEKLRRKKLRRKTLVIKLGITTVLAAGVFFIKKYYTYVPDINLGEESLRQVSSQIIDADLGYSDDNLRADEKTMGHLKKREDLMNHALKVVGCDPNPGTPVRKGTDVVLYVNWDDEPEIKDLNDFSIKKAIIEEKERNFHFKVKYRKVPGVKGLSLEEAENVLKKAKIPYHIGEPVYSDTIEAGDVLSQDPEAGTAVDEDTEVVLVVSIGRKPVQVPNVVGMSEKKAKNKLEKLGLKVTVEEEEGYNDTVNAGDVVRQSKNEGESVPPGTEIRIVISKEDKPKPTLTPTPKPTETPAPPSPTPTEVPVPTETPAPPSPTPTEVPVPTETPAPVPTEVIDDSDDQEILEEEVD